MGAEPGERCARPSRSRGCGSRDTKACCARHKVEPLFARARRLRRVVHRAAARAVGVARRTLEEVEPFRLPSGQVLTQGEPARRWSTKEVWAYAKAHDIPLLPLYDLGYTSIGCEPCTSLPLDPGNERSGRWQGQKLECGIHIQSEG